MSKIGQGSLQCRNLAGLRTASGQERPFCHLRKESGLPPTPDILRHRSEPPLRVESRCGAVALG